jgi:integrase
VSFPSGTKSLSFAYSRGRPKSLLLGHRPPLDVNGAGHGHGPRPQAAANPNYDPVAERKLSRGAIKFRELKERYYADPKNQKKKSHDYTKRLIENHVVKKWGDMVADQITCSDARNLLSSFNRPNMKKHIQVLTGAIFNWGIKPNQELVKSNPFAGMEGAERNSRDRVVEDHEFAPVWRALDELGLIRAHALKVIWLTGQRPGEVAHMRREHIHVVGPDPIPRWETPGEQKKQMGAWWHMPGEPVKELGWRGTKNGRDHRAFLSPEVMRLINEIDPDATTGFVFANRRGRPVRDLDKGMRDLSAALGLGADV